jgi:hypothetical protein
MSAQKKCYVPSMVSALQSPPQCCAADSEQGGNFAGRFAAALDELAGVINLGRGKFGLRAEFHPAPPRRLLPAFVRSTFNPRSNSASNATMCSMAFPSG